MALHWMDLWSLCFPRYCHVRVPEGLLKDLLPGPVTLVMERSEELNKDLNPLTPVSQIFSCVPRLLSSGFHQDPGKTRSSPLPTFPMIPFSLRLIACRHPHS